MSETSHGNSQTKAGVMANFFMDVWRFMMRCFLVVGVLTSVVVIRYYEETAIILGDLAEIQRAEREAPETMRAMKK
jgi:hypothetical protein